MKIKDKKKELINANSFWKNLIKEREDLLKKIDLKEWKKWEKEFESKLEKEINKRHVKKPFFNWKLLLNDRINFYIVVGNANVGKSYSSRQLILDYVKRGKRFIILRTSKVELDSYKSSLKDWLTEHDMELRKDTIINPMNKEILGFTIALSTSLNYKSSEFGNVELIVYDEFMKPNERLKDKFKLLTRLILTAQRQNKNFKVIMLANYIKAEDDILLSLGFANFEKTGDLVFNPLTKAMLWTIPANVFREFKDTSNLGYVLSLESKKSYVLNYGGSFTNTTMKNLLNKDWNIKDTEPIFSLYYNEVFLLFSKWKEKMIIDFSLYEEVKSLNIPIYTLDPKSFLKFRGLQLIKYENFYNLLPYYINEDIIINGDITIRDLMLQLLDTAIFKSRNAIDRLFKKIEVKSGA